jgi:hypothetical protein
MMGAAPFPTLETDLVKTAPPAEGEAEDYYDAACMPPVVLAAVQKSALLPARLVDIQIKAGDTSRN